MLVEVLYIDYDEPRRGEIFFVNCKIQTNNVHHIQFQILLEI